MRDVFVRALETGLDKNPDVMVMTADLGFGVLDSIATNHPDRFINVGVAEQNMAMIAAGLALEGHRVFTYSIGNFPTLRCLEQLRNDVAYHSLPVVVVSVGAGFSYGPLGASHHATEDLAVMLSVPGFDVVSPGCEWEVRAITEQLLVTDRPTYLRLDKSAAPDTGTDGDTLTYGAIRQVRHGSRTAVLATGGVLGEAVRAWEQTELEGAAFSLYSVPFLRPFDHATLAAIVDGHDKIVTLEEHVATGGLAATVAQSVAEHGSRSVRLSRMSLPSAFEKSVGSQSYLRNRNGLDCDALLVRLREIGHG
jgi:transketolase